MKVNIEQKTRLINEFRIQNELKTFTYKELKVKMEGITKNCFIFTELLKLFPKEKVGKLTIYEMPKNPIHKSIVENIWKKQALKQRKVMSDAEMISSLESKGYQIRKIKGFDMQKFAEENPNIYEKYLIYEE